jgi:hypothetical protein
MSKSSKKRPDVLDKHVADRHALPDPEIEERKSAAFSDGNDAAMRIGRYEGATDIPPCPHAPGTPEYDSWQEGFDFGTEYLIHPPELEDPI